MSKWITITILFLMAGGAALAAQFGGLEGHAYHDCSAGRVAVFGYGNRSEPVAELAAIVRWEEEATAKYGKSFGEWALAQDRSLKCKRWRQTPYRQCKIAALPCKPKATDL
jgi:hypothetical protein